MFSNTVFLAGKYVQQLQCERSSGFCAWQPRLFLPASPNADDDQATDERASNASELPHLQHVAREEKRAAEQHDDAPQSNCGTQPSLSFSHVETVPTTEGHVHRLDARHLHRPGHPTEADAWIKFRAGVRESQPSEVAPFSRQHLR